MTDKNSIIPELFPEDYTQEQAQQFADAAQSTKGNAKELSYQMASLISDLHRYFDNKIPKELLPRISHCGELAYQNYDKYGHIKPEEVIEEVRALYPNGQVSNA